MTFFQLKNCAAIIIICNQHRGDRSCCGLQEKCCSFVVYINIYNFHLKKKKKDESRRQRHCLVRVFLPLKCVLPKLWPCHPPTSLDFWMCVCVCVRWLNNWNSSESVHWEDKLNRPWVSAEEASAHSVKCGVCVCARLRVCFRVLFRLPASVRRKQRERESLRQKRRGEGGDNLA